MPLMERAGSRNPRLLTYECPKCSYVAERSIGRATNRQYGERIPCPRCLRDSNAITKPPED